jgi:hypothetical protein
MLKALKMPGALMMPKAPQTPEALKMLEALRTLTGPKMPKGLEMPEVRTSASPPSSQSCTRINFYSGASLKTSQ